MIIIFGFFGCCPRAIFFISIIYTGNDQTINRLDQLRYIFLRYIERNLFK